MSRKKARDVALKILYSADINNDISIEFVDKSIEFFMIFDFDLERTPIENDEIEFIKSVCYGYVENNEKVDRIISLNSKGWEINRLARVDLAILRVSTFEILFREDIPVNVIVNEAIENSKLYSKDDSYKFINGVLGSIAKSEGRS